MEGIECKNAAREGQTLTGSEGAAVGTAGESLGGGIPEKLGGRCVITVTESCSFEVITDVEGGTGAEAFPGEGAGGADAVFRVEDLTGDGAADLEGGVGSSGEDTDSVVVSFHDEDVGIDEEVVSGIGAEGDDDGSAGIGRDGVEGDAADVRDVVVENIQNIADGQSSVGIQSDGSRVVTNGGCCREVHVPALHDEVTLDCEISGRRQQCLCMNET